MADREDDERVEKIIPSRSSIAEDDQGIIQGE